MSMTNRTQPTPAAHVTALEDDLALLTEELIARQDELVALYNLTQSARSCVDSGQLMAVVLGEVAQLFKGRSAAAVLDVPPHSARLFPAATPVIAADWLLAATQRTGAGDSDRLVSDSAQLPAGVSAVLLAPVRSDGRTVGALALVSRDGVPFTYPERKLLRVIAEHAGAHLENVLLHETRLAQAQLQSEMALARQVQLRLLPQTIPTVGGITVSASTQPAREVGGDFYDFVRRDEALTFAVGDVAGKGMSAALLMGMTRTTLRNAALFMAEPTPARILAQMNAFLYDDFTEVSMFATVFVGRYEPTTRTLHYANAGHAPVIYCPVGSTARLLEADGTALGVLPDSFAGDHRLHLAPGDVLLVATDGLNEARDADGALFGYDRLRALVERLAGESAETIAHQLLAAVHAHSGGAAQDDDETLLVIKGVAQ